MHMHRDISVCAIEHDELTAVLPLLEQCGHAAQPGADLGADPACHERRREPERAQPGTGDPGLTVLPVHALEDVREGELLTRQPRTLLGLALGGR